MYKNYAVSSSFKVCCTSSSHSTYIIISYDTRRKKTFEIKEKSRDQIQYRNVYLTEACYSWPAHCRRVYGCVAKYATPVSFFAKGAIKYDLNPIKVIYYENIIDNFFYLL